MFIQTTRNSYQPKTDVFSTFHSEPRIRNYYTTRTYRYHNVEKSNNNCIEPRDTRIRKDDVFLSNLVKMEDTIDSTKSDYN